MSALKPSEETEDESGLSARELVETVFLLGVGAASFTRERLHAVVDDLVARGRLSGEAARVVSEHVSAHGQDRAQTGATRVDVDEIDFRLRQIEHRLRLLESRIDRCTGDRDS